MEPLIKRLPGRNTLSSGHGHYRHQGRHQYPSQQSHQSCARHNIAQAIINTTGITVINATIDTRDILVIMDTTAIMGITVIKASLYENIHVTVHQ